MSMVNAAASLFDTPERREWREKMLASRETALRLGFRDPFDGVRRNAGRTFADEVRSRVEISAGVVAVRRHDPIRAEKSAERARLGAERWHELAMPLRDALVLARVGFGEDSPEYAAAWQAYMAHWDSRPGRREVSSWSAKSRARMVQRIASLDYEPLLGAGRPPVMLTLTYPGDWLTVAPSSAVCRRHVEAFRKRFARRFGVPLVGIWKREFQRRGAPHYHILMAMPEGVGLREFRSWAGETWAAVVAHPDRDVRARHARVGVGVDMAQGARCTDPRRIGVYFSKHGSFAAKDYQNEAPAEWAGESVGRFWGVWGLRAHVVTVDVRAAEALAIARTMRRWSRAQGDVAVVSRWRSRHRIDPETGEVLSSRWFRRPSATRIRRLGRDTGFLVVNDGPSLAASLARYADQVSGRSSPTGRFLP